MSGAASRNSTGPGVVTPSQYLEVDNGSCVSGCRHEELRGEDRLDDPHANRSPNGGTAGRFAFVRSYQRASTADHAQLRWNPLLERTPP